MPIIFCSALSLATFFLVVMVRQFSKLFSLDLQFRFSISFYLNKVNKFE